MTLVKICGLTREDDVRRAAAHGAAACGFVLTAGPRRIPAERACRLAELAGDVLTVAVVTTESPEWISARLAECRVAAVQLSAGADGPTVAAVREAAAVRGLWPRVIAAADTPDAADADLILYDGRTATAYGGTGVALDWSALAGIPLPPRERLVLAGGLAPGNVAQAIAALHPTLVDVSSGVEAAPGIKDERLLTAFFAAVERADRAGGMTS
jgi:phosphoribosylanthranilate isomerase